MVEKISVNGYSIEVEMVKKITDCPQGSVIYTKCTAQEAFEKFLKSGAVPPSKMFGYKQVTGTIWCIPIEDVDAEREKRLMGRAR